MTRPAFGYGRCSTLGQTDTSPETQRACIIAGMTHYGYDNAGIFIDEDQSAFYTPFLQRPQAIRLFNTITPGTALFVYHTDRAYRRLADFVMIQEWSQEHDIHLYVTSKHSEAIDWDNPDAWLEAANEAARNEYASRITSSRTREALEIMRQQGRYCSPRAPYGHQAKRTSPTPRRRKGAPFTVPDEFQFHAMAEIYRRHVIHGETFRAIADTFRQANRPGLTAYAKAWNYSLVRRLFLYYRDTILPTRRPG